MAEFDTKLSEIMPTIGTVAILAMPGLTTLGNDTQIEDEILYACHILETHTLAPKRLAVVEKISKSSVYLLTI